MKKKTKEKLNLLIEKYERVKSAGRLKSYTEEETKKDFILPLFEILGWDIYNKNKDEVSAEESMSSGRVDYGFYPNNRIKFYLEAKKLSADLHSEHFANQTVRYSWNKGATWAILTDFKSIIVFNAQDIKRSLADKLYFEIPYTDYLNRFDQLWLLSKESFQNDSLDKDAEAHGKKFQKIPVTSLLYEDLEKCRDMLTKELGQMNEKVSPDLLDEGVQKLLDRLIFIRVAEDRGVEDKILIPLAREARFGNGNGKLYESMVKEFREFDNFYNSNLFSPHPFEQWEEYSGVTERVINTLYGKAGYYEYDFKAMPADVLGAVYESYLGHRLAKSKKGLTVAKDAGKRKEHGIYYTPSFIVDYIVKNALGPVLEKCRSISDIKKIKVLDPACGSGSFLIKALNMISDKYKDFSARDNELLKIQILEENIYGVDLDPQAVEITRLNLLINTLNKRMKLPLLDNIKNGNSLISGTDEELKKYFGKNFRDKKPFNWREEFPEVFKQGGFDVVIGNPPYVMVENLPSDERQYMMDEYETAIKRFDIYIAFIEKGLKILKTNGFLSIIIPYPFLNQNYAEKLRKKILSDFNLVEVLDLSEIKIFGEAVVRNCIITLKKPIDKKDMDKKIIVKKVSNEEDVKNLNNLPLKLFEPKFFLSLPKSMYRIDLDDSKNSLLKKIENKSLKIGTFCYVNWGARSGNVKKYVVKEPINNQCKKMINARNIGRYNLNYTDDYLVYNKKELYNPMFEELFESQKIIVRDISGKSRLKATLDTDKYYAEHTVSLVVPWYFLETVKRQGLIITDEQIKLSQKYDLLYEIALINSKLINWYFVSKLGGGLHVYPDDIKQLPICQIDFLNKIEKSKYDNLVKLADKMLQFNKELQKIPENSNKWNSIKSEIEKTDKKIDEEVYKLYGLTPEEIGVVEEGV